MLRSGRFQNAFGPSEIPSKSNFNVVIAYEDLEAGKNARRTYDYLAQHLGHDCQFANEMWSFDVLSIPRLRELAARDAMQADIIIVACHGGAPLPEAVKSWIEIWLAEEVNAIALVALFDSASDMCSKTRELREYFAEVARRGNMEFFAQPDRWPNPGRSSGGIHSLPTLTGSDVDARFSASVEFRQRHESFPHWGINE
jgi:hypothetical protein